MVRARCIEEIRNRKDPWDLVVIGGGSSGLGVALDALSRGLTVALVEKSDFAKGTSSRSTKLLHGGVRYLAQGNFALVYEALKERGLIMKNAPHVCEKQSFIIPIYSYSDMIKYGAGLKLYDLLAGSLGIGKSKWISSTAVGKKLPTIRRKNLKGGIIYFDGQFDDARLALSIAQTCIDLGGSILNYMKVTSLLKDDQGKIKGVKVKDQIEGGVYDIHAKAVVNATGVFADKVLKMDNKNAKKTLRPSQGAHVVLALKFLGGKDALMIPKTSDGRVLFGIPWHGKLLLGTTDTLRKKPTMEPQALEEEIDFILETCGNYLDSKPGRTDVLSVFAGLRPLAAPTEEGAKTKEISRSHKVSITESHLISIIGGKWTTFRKMGEDTVNAIKKHCSLKMGRSTSENIKLHGFPGDQKIEGHMAIYGSDAKEIKDLISQNPALDRQLHNSYPNTFAEVVWMVRNEMAMTVEDVLARRMRILFLDARAAMEIAPAVAKIMKDELGLGDGWEEKQISNFQKLAEKYVITPKTLEV